MTERLYHGGVPGLRVGDVLAGGHDPAFHPGCKVCEQRKNGTATGFARTEHPDEVYCTTDRDYARVHASMYGYGDLYRVEPIDGEPWVRSDEDEIVTYRSPRMRVAGVVDRAVRLTWKDRRRMVRRWDRAEKARERP